LVSIQNFSEVFGKKYHWHLIARMALVILRLTVGGMNSPGSPGLFMPYVGNSFLF